MNSVPVRYLLFALLAGALWGAVGLAIAGPILGAPSWGGVAVSPAIGLVVAFAFRGFRERPVGARIALSLVSLYLATGLFALAVGLADAARPMTDRIPSAVVIQALMGIWWGVSFTIYLPLLWALAYFTHSLLGRADVRHAAGGVAGGPGAAGLAEVGRAPAPPAAVHTREWVRGTQEERASLVRGVVIGALAVAATLVLLTLLRKFRGPLGEMAVLLAVVGFVFFGARGAWRWWKGQPATVAAIGVLGALGFSAGGWLLVAIVRALSKVSGENYGMIVVWPIVFVLAAATILGGVLAAAVGLATLFTAVTKPPPNRVFVALGGAAAVVLNLLFVVALARLVFTG